MHITGSLSDGTDDVQLFTWSGQLKKNTIGIFRRDLGLKLKCLLWATVCVCVCVCVCVSVCICQLVVLFAGVLCCVSLTLALKWVSWSLWLRGGWKNNVIFLYVVLGTINLNAYHRKLSEAGVNRKCSFDTEYQADFKSHCENLQFHCWHEEFKQKIFGWFESGNYLAGKTFWLRVAHRQMGR